MPDAAPWRRWRKNSSRAIGQQAPILGSVQGTEINSGLFRRGNVGIEKMAAIGQKRRITKGAASFWNVSRRASYCRDLLNASARRPALRKQDDALPFPRSATRTRGIA